MSDDSAKAEEERIQRAMNRKTRTSMVVKPTHSNEPSAPTPSFSQKQPIASKPATEKPKPVPAITSLSANQSASRSAEIEALQLKKRTILGTIGTTRRDLEEVRSEIAKLKSKETELVSLLEKRDQAVQQLNQDIEDLEKKDHSEELRRQEDAKAKRVAAEVERRRQDEIDEERKKLDEQEGRNFNPQPIYSPRGGEEDAKDLDGLTAEEQRIMRAMSRPGKGGTAGATTGGGRASISKPSSAVSKPAVNEAEKQRIAEENRRKDEEQRAHQERDLQQRIAHLQTPGGVRKTFISSQCYDFDAEVKFVADFTNFEEIPITTPIDNNFTYSVTWSVKPGPHFYLFKINGKTEINKNLATGLAPNGSLMNKVDC